MRGEERRSPWTGRYVGALAGVAVSAVVLAAGSALAWGSATHAFVNDTVGGKYTHRGAAAADFLYGGMAPDVFNYIFDRPACLQPLFAKTHYQGGYLEFYELTNNPWERALGYGFVSHNNDWGSDVPAHGPLLDPGQGYVIQKAAALESVLDLSALFGTNVALRLCHAFVEYGVDILVRNLDPAVGSKTATAALARNPVFPARLAEAYANDMAACGVPANQAEARVRLDEARFRAELAAYGAALDSSDDAVVLGEVSRQLAGLAGAFLAAYGLTLPPGVDPVAVTRQGVGAAIQLCAGDYEDAVRETVAAVEEEMNEFVRPRGKGK